MARRKKKSPSKAIASSNILSIIDPTIRVDNTLLRGKFLSDSDWATKAFFTLMYQLQKAPNENMEVVMSLRSLCDILGQNKYDYAYDWVQVLCVALTNIKIQGFSEKEGGSFNVFAGASYKDGVFKAIFVPQMGKYILGAMNQYTTLQMQYLLRFKTTRYTFTALLYSYLKSYAWTIQDDKGYTVIPLTVDELKYHTGLTIEEKQKIEFKQIENNDLRRRYLEPAVKQINELTDILVDYEPSYGGHGAKITSFTFTVRWQSDLRLCGATKEDEDNLIEKFGDRFSIEQLVALYVAAKKDIALISRNIEKLDKKVLCKTVKFEKGTSSYFVYLQNMIASDANNTGDEVVTAKERMSMAEKSSSTRKISQNAKKTLD